MAGYWNLSFQQFHDLNGKPYPGAKAYFFEAATLAPLTTYSDASLGTEHPHPVQANGFGIFPPVFFDEADAFYRQRVTTANGVLIAGSDVISIPIIGPGEGGGGSEVPVDPNALLQTGDLKARYGTGAHAGWVRANGRTIGSQTSGAAERANADCQFLFEYLWEEDSTLTVSGGRGLSAGADWSANKSIALPDWRGYALAALDDMGSTAAGRLTASYFGTAATVLGAVGGLESDTLTTAKIPSHLHPQTAQQPTFTYSTRSDISPEGAATVVASIVASGGVNTVTPTADATPGDTGSTGGGAAHNNVQPTKLATIYIKL